MFAKPPARGGIAYPATARRTNSARHCVLLAQELSQATGVRPESAAFGLVDSSF